LFYRSVFTGFSTNLPTGRKNDHQIEKTIGQEVEGQIFGIENRVSILITFLKPAFTNSYENTRILAKNSV